ncbi:MAG TPA: phosphate signaling complex protein PhoU [Firmicutes bacterium]|nr:phosphate signaling complex protein PhoU [Gelria sp. Kuro-4]MDK2927844.1 phosphate transport system protein [Bacillota bacterium]BCV25368.1 phosphate transport system regulatory protein PhoU [Gelria sp. Kuro-4]HHV56769.1 phosphate signaling complex protein PhoU [Bacillota bacterium]
MTGRKSFHLELEELQQDLLRMGSLVEKAIAEAVRSLAERDLELAEKVVAGDDLIDTMELDIENRCLRLLALQQPMASDLRVIGTALKIVTDLERMADHASDIAKVTIRLQGQPLIKPLVDVPRMAAIAREMTRQSLDAFVQRDVNMALAMIESDHEVDHLYSQIFRELLTYMMEDPRTIQQATYLLFVGMYLERIADHATNLGEWIIYMVTGEKKELNR